MPRKPVFQVVFIFFLAAGRTLAQEPIVNKAGEDVFDIPAISFKIQLNGEDRLVSAAAVVVVRSLTSLTEDPKNRLIEIPLKIDTVAQRIRVLPMKIGLKKYVLNRQSFRWEPYESEQMPKKLDINGNVIPDNENVQVFREPFYVKFFFNVSPKDIDEPGMTEDMIVGTEYTIKDVKPSAMSVLPEQAATFFAQSEHVVELEQQKYVEGKVFRQTSVYGGRLNVSIALQAAPFIPVWLDLSKASEENVNCLYRLASRNASATVYGEMEYATEGILLKKIRLSGETIDTCLGRKKTEDPIAAPREERASADLSPPYVTGRVVQRTVANNGAATVHAEVQAAPFIPVSLDFTGVGQEAVNCLARLAEQKKSATVFGDIEYSKAGAALRSIRLSDDTLDLCGAREKSDAPTPAPAPSRRPARKPSKVPAVNKRVQPMLKNPWQ